MTVLEHRVPRKAYDSTQSIQLEQTVDHFDQRTNPDALLRVLHQYFKIAEQSAGGLVRMHWSASRPRFALLGSPVAIIRMGEPTFEASPHRRAIRMVVQGGLVVSPMSRATLSIAFTRRTDSLWASVELRDYMPRAGQIASVDWLYRHTQVRIHEWVGLRYVRVLRRQWLGQNNAG